MDPIKITATSITVALISAIQINEAASETLELSGFVQAHAVVRTVDVDCPAGTECDVPFNDQRAQIKAEGGNESGSVAYLGKIDLIHNWALNDIDSEVRELYVDYHTDDFTVRGGRQVITWGAGDLLFINDVFPKDWGAFYSGQPLEYLKLGSDAVKLDLFMGSTTLEMVISDFRADRLPDDRQFIISSPFSASLPRDMEEPEAPEYALKLSGYLRSWDAAVYASRGYYHAPALMATATVVRGTHPRLNTLGISLSGPVASGVLNLETGYYDSEDDGNGADPTMENSQARLLIGYTRQIGQETQIGIQAYAEWMQDYDAYKHTLPSGYARRDEVRTVATVRFTQYYLHQTLTVNLFAFLGISENDSYVIPSVRYAFSDNLWMELGANILNGSRSGMFGTLGDNDNAYVTMRYAF